MAPVCPAAKALAFYVRSNALLHSPWLFNKQDRYTMVGDIRVAWPAQDPATPALSDAFCRELTRMCDEHAAECRDLGLKQPHVLLGATPDAVRSNRSRYDPWRAHCGFEYDFEDLTLHVVRIAPHTLEAYFTDDQGRRSRRAILLEETDESEEERDVRKRWEEWTSDVPETRLIPWLLCQN